MNISNFEDLLRAAKQQSEPQRLLFVFADAELPDNCTAEQRARFQAGDGGALVPLMSVDKKPGDLSTFLELAEESRQFGRDWAVVFVAALSGRGGRAPTDVEADQSLQHMIEAIKSGSFGALMPFDRQGQPLIFD
ncbi:MAG: hypothetical protein Q8M03_14245 [Legionella sp.]|nr:hypothetical protein [Legionella sp.]